MALAGILDTVYSAMNFFMQRPDGSLALRILRGRGTLVDMGIVALAAGVCAVAAGVWSFRNGKSWFLMLNGIACSALGLIFTFWTGPLGFGTVAFLIAVMAISLALYELETARPLRGHVADEWLLGAAGIASAAFALWFLACVFSWIKLDPASPAQSLHWMGAYFAFSAIGKLALAWRVYRPGPSKLSPWKDLPALGTAV